MRVDVANATLAPHVRKGPCSLDESHCNSGLCLLACQLARSLARVRHTCLQCMRTGLSDETSCTSADPMEPLKAGAPSLPEESAVLMTSKLGDVRIALRLHMSILIRVAVRFGSALQL